MPRGKMTAGREARMVATRNGKRSATDSGADYAAAPNKRCKADDKAIDVKVPIDEDEEDPEWQGSSDDFTPEPVAKPKATRRGRYKGKAPAVEVLEQIPQENPTSCQIGANGGIMQWRDEKNKRPPYVPGSFKWIPQGKKPKKSRKVETDDENPKKSRKTSDEPRKLLAWGSKYHSVSAPCIFQF